IFDTRWHVIMLITPFGPRSCEVGQGPLERARQGGLMGAVGLVGPRGAGGGGGGGGGRPGRRLGGRRGRCPRARPRSAASCGWPGPGPDRLAGWRPGTPPRTE